MKRPVSIGLSPNIQKDDVFQAMIKLLSPWSYQRGISIVQLEQWFQRYFSVPFVASFSNARSALFVILEAMEIGKEDEVILQAFTCIVVPNAIVARGAKPIYADIDSSLTLDPKDIEKKISKKTKAILVQHTFGISSDMHAIMQIARKYNLFVIEDVAHTIGGEYKGKKLGSFGDAAIFSFGRDKAFSSVFGGIAIATNKKIGEKIKKAYQHLSYPNPSWIIQQLFHPIAFSFILPLYTSGIGKVLLLFFQKMRMLSFPVTPEEKRGFFDFSNVKKLPNALADLAMHQVGKIEIYNNRRKEISTSYQKVCKELALQSIADDTTQPLLRFPLVIENPAKMRAYFRSQKGILLGDWYAHVIDPKGSDCATVFYTYGSCPLAESMASKIVNLPTYPTLSNNDVDQVLELLKKYLHLEVGN